MCRDYLVTHLERRGEERKYEGEGHCTTHKMNTVCYPNKQGLTWFICQVDERSSLMGSHHNIELCMVRYERSDSVCVVRCMYLR